MTVTKNANPITPRPMGGRRPIGGYPKDDATAPTSTPERPRPVARPIPTAIPTARPISIPAAKTPSTIKREIEEYLNDPLPIVIEEIAKLQGQGRFGDRKVFISALWDRVHRRVGMTLPEFKTWLIAQHREARLVLSRADLVSAMPQHLVDASEAWYDGRSASFHFVHDPSVR